MSSLQAIVDFYKHIIPDSDGLLALENTPLPLTIWTNTLKITPEKLIKLMREDGYDLEPLAWNPLAFRVESESVVGKSWQYQAGLFQIQEEVSMLPGVLLAASPGEKVLDLCAAPGNKTAQVAVSMNNTGTLVANDRNYSRMRAVGHILKRLNLINISTTIYDGVIFPSVDNYFDKVLVDVPCSCEGTFRKNKNKLTSPNQQHSLQIAKVQYNLLNKAMQLVRGSGKVIYSTCTFSPEENEAVVSRLLDNMPGQVRVLPLSIEGFNYSEGVQSWQSQQYHPQVKNSIRVWPHQNNSGGFFVAVLEKISNAENLTAAKKFRFDQQKVEGYLTELDQRFKFPELTAQSYQFLTESNRGIYLTNKDNLPPKGLRIDATGLFFLKTNTRFPKLTTAAAMLLGDKVKANRVEITKAQLELYFTQETSVLSETQASSLTDTGFVIVSYQDIILGVGLYLSAGGGRPARLQSQFPKTFK